MRVKGAGTREDPTAEWSRACILGLDSLEFESIFHHLPFFEKDHFIFQNSSFLIKLEKESLVP